MQKALWLLAAVVGALGPGVQDRVPALDSPVARAFAPPPDGRLTDDHVRLYISVNRAASAFSKDRPDASPDPIAVSQIAERARAELSAARRLGVDPDEYRWIRARIAEATRPTGQAVLAPLLAEIDAQARASGGSVRREAGQVEDVPTSAGVSESATAYNREFLKKYRAQLEAVITPSDSSDTSR